MNEMNDTVETLLCIIRGLHNDIITLKSEVECLALGKPNLQTSSARSGLNSVQWST